MDDGSAETASSGDQQSSVGRTLVGMLDAFVESHTQPGGSQWKAVSPPPSPPGMSQAGGVEAPPEQTAARQQSVSERVQQFEKAVGEEPEVSPAVGALVSGVLDNLVQMCHQRLREHEQQQERERRLLLDKERRLFYPNDIQFSAARTHR
jgi:hypothetical protein